MNDSETHELYTRILREPDGALDAPYHTPEEAIDNVAGKRHPVGYATAWAIECALMIEDETKRRQELERIRAFEKEQREDPADPYTSRGNNPLSVLKHIVGW